MTIACDAHRTFSCPKDKGKVGRGIEFCTVGQCSDILHRALVATLCGRTIANANVGDAQCRLGWSGRRRVASNSKALLVLDEPSRRHPRLERPRSCHLVVKPIVVLGPLQNGLSRTATLLCNTMRVQVRESRFGECHCMGPAITVHQAD